MSTGYIDCYIAFILPLLYISIFHAAAAVSLLVSHHFSQKVFTHYTQINSTKEQNTHPQICRSWSSTMDGSRYILGCWWAQAKILNAFPPLYRISKLIVGEFVFFLTHHLLITRTAGVPPCKLNGDTHIKPLLRCINSGQKLHRKPLMPWIYSSLSVLSMSVPPDSPGVNCDLQRYAQDCSLCSDAISCLSLHFLTVVLGECTSRPQS